MDYFKIWTLLQKLLVLSYIWPCVPRCKRQMCDWSSSTEMKELPNNKSEVLNDLLQESEFYCVHIYGHFTAIMLWLNQQQISSSCLQCLNMSHLNGLIKISCNLKLKMIYSQTSLGFIRA